MRFAHVLAESKDPYWLLTTAHWPLPTDHRPLN